VRAPCHVPGRGRATGGGLSGPEIDGRAARPARSVCLLLVCVVLAACAGPQEASPAVGPTPSPAEGLARPTPVETPASPEAAQPGTPAPAAPTPDAAPAPDCPDSVCYAEPERVGVFDAEMIPGASGLAVSRLDPDRLYILDDREGTSEVWVVRTDGTMLGAIGVAGLDALDTEALGVGPCGPGDPTTCIYVGDIGDNLRSRTDITVHRFPEPDLEAGLPAAAVDAAVIRLRYPGAPEDAEALLIDDEGVPHIVTKAAFDRETRETGPARLLRAPGWSDGTLEDLGQVPVPPPATPMQSLFVGNVVTGGDQLPGRVILRTYDQVVELVADTADAPLASLSRWRTSTPPAPFEVQSEAIAYAPDGCGYYTVGERSGDIWFTRCR
jgi:hypothetical protein